LGYSQQQAQGTSLAMLLPPIGVLAFMNYYKAGFVDLKAAVLMITTFLVGSYLSSKYVVELPEYMIKKIFGVFLLMYALKLLLEKQ
jgi:hypothetical protein